MIRIEEREKENILLGIVSVSNDIEQARQSIIRSIKDYILSIDRYKISFQGKKDYDKDNNAYMVLGFGSNRVDFIYKSNVYSKRFEELSLGQLLDIFEYIKSSIYEQIK